MNDMKSIYLPRRGQGDHIFKALEGAAAAQIQLQPIAVINH